MMLLAGEGDDVPPARKKVVHWMLELEVGVDPALVHLLFLVIMGKGGEVFFYRRGT